MKKSKSINKNTLRTKRSEVLKPVSFTTRLQRFEIDYQPKREILSFTPFRALAHNRKQFKPKIFSSIKHGLKSSSLLFPLSYDKIAFKEPLKELPCARRRARRRVLFALRLTGKGSGAKNHKFTADSLISCKG